jgi:spectinomycin phosphotransferase
LLTALAQGWRLGVASMEYVPEGGGSYHWKVTDDTGQPHFVTLDDLDDKDWLGDTRPAVLEGLSRALSTAAALRYQVGLEFVVAPVAACEGGYLRRLDGRYTVSVFPFLAGQSFPFGPYTDARLRLLALDLIAALHRATPAVQGRAPQHVPRFAGRDDLNAFLLEPDRLWDSGPFAEAARDLLLTRTGDLARLATEFDLLADRTAPARAEPVITHGEPHPGNLRLVDGSLVLIDWDTVALAPAERDLSLITMPGHEDADRYQEATGRQLDPAVITLYRLRWYLDDLGSAIRLFRNPHRDTLDTRRWRDGLAPLLARLPQWLDRLS